jgi:hypothetical protein
VKATTLFSDGFETGNLSAWSTNGSGGGGTSPSVQTLLVHSGVYGAQEVINTAWGAYSYLYKSISPVTTTYLRAYLAFGNQIDSGTWLGVGNMIYASSSLNWLLALYRPDASHWQWQIRDMSVSPGAIVCTSPSFTGLMLNHYYCVEMAGNVSVTLGAALLYVDGVQVASATGLDTGAGQIVTVGIQTYAQVYSETAGMTLYFDDVVAADSYIGPMGGGGSTPSPYFSNANMVWICNTFWVYQNQEILNTTQKRHAVIDRLASENITWANVWIGYWNHTTYTIYPDHPIDNETYRDLISYGHSKGIKVMAWAMNDAYGINVDASHRSLLYATMTAWLTYDYGSGVYFDGWNDDIESAQKVENMTLATEYINYINNATPVLHALGKNFTACVAMDYTRTWNSRLHCDYICSMFFSSVSYFEDEVNRDAFWQAEFQVGAYPGTPPASPLVMGIYQNKLFNRYDFNYQLDQCSRLMSSYGHPNLAGFCIWMYEYIGSYDWSEWHYWINNMTQSYQPRAHSLTVRSNVPETPMQINGSTVLTDRTILSFEGALVTVTAPENATLYNHDPLFGLTTHGTSNGYDTDIYTSGPWNLTSPAAVNFIYVYANSPTYVKVAIYNTIIANVSGFPNNWPHPYQLLTQSLETYAAAGWDQIRVSNYTLPAGQYFIAIKFSNYLTIAVGASYQWYEYRGQFLASWYGNPFPDTINASDLGVGVCYELAMYVAAASATTTPMYFTNWQDGSTDRTLNLYIKGSDTWTATYIENLLQEPYVDPLSFLNQYWAKGDFAGFFIGIFGFAFGDPSLFFDFLAFIIGIIFYIRFKSVMICFVFWMICGFAIASLVPTGVPFGILLGVIALGTLLFKLFMARRNEYA